MEFLSEPAQRIHDLSVQRFGRGRAVEMVGHSPAYVATLRKLEKVARYQDPVLITGESGAGKEQYAQAVHLLGSVNGRPYVSINCPQYQDGNVTVSELFGHVKGSFTGATGDHAGAFEQADGGVIFLDEVGDLHLTAQAMLLRALSTGEYRPLGSSRTKSASPRVVSATNRPLNQLAGSHEFRYDLLFRLRHFHLALPALRERGDDWRLLIDFCLRRMEREHGHAKRFSPGAMRFLEGYHWPGNVRQVVGVVSTGYAMADGDLIEPEDFESLIERRPEMDVDSVSGRFDRVVQGREPFWEIVAQAFLDRDLNRAQMKSIVKRGLTESAGSYRRLLDVLHLPASDYQRFMDFLRHHDIKPS